MTLILNIGLQIGKTAEHLTTTQVVQTLEGVGLAISRMLVVPKPASGEPFIVVAVDHVHRNKTPQQAIHNLATYLGQDCIATWVPATNTGHLIGPNATAWGEFNPEFFTLPDGARLSDVLALIAHRVPQPSNVSR